MSAALTGVLAVASAVLVLGGLLLVVRFLARRLRDSVLVGVRGESAALAQRLVGKLDAVDAKAADRAVALAQRVEVASDAITVLGKRVAGVESTQGEVTAQFERAGAALRAAQGDILAKVDTVARRVEETDRQSTALSTRMQELTASVSETQEVAAKADEELKQEITATLDDLGARNFETQRKLHARMKDKLNARMTDLTACMQNVQQEILAPVDGLVARVEEIERESVARADGLAAKVAERVDGLGAKHQEGHRKLGVRIKVLAASVEAMQDATEATREALKSGVSIPSSVDAAEVRGAQRVRREKRYFAARLKQSRIRALHLPQIFPGIEQRAVEIGAIDPDTGQANHVDLLYVCAMARHIEARRIFEFGTYLGRTTYHLALGELDREVFSLDLDPGGDLPTDLKIGQAVRAVHKRGLQGHFFRGGSVESRITQLHGDSRTFDFSRYRKSMDFIFIDAGHSLDLVTNDTARAFDMLRAGGAIVWHDYAPKTPDLVDFAKEFSEKRPLFWVLDTSLLVYVDGVDASAVEARSPVYAREVLKPS